MSEDVWYSYGEIKFYRRHVQFICESAVIITSGRWPPRISGYIDPPVRSERFRTEASFVKPGGTWAEVELRLTRCCTGWTEDCRTKRCSDCGKDCSNDGLLAIGYYLDHFQMDWLTEWQKCDQEKIWQRIKRAISYAGSGPCRRWEPCEYCRDLDTCQRKKREGVGYGEWVKRRHYR